MLVCCNEQLPGDATFSPGEASGSKSPPRDTTSAGASLDGEEGPEATEASEDDAESSGEPPGGVSSAVCMGVVAFDAFDACKHFRLACESPDAATGLLINVKSFGDCSIDRKDNASGELRIETTEKDFMRAGRSGDLRRSCAICSASVELIDSCQVTVQSSSESAE
jgi:hypothetical protein